jgi:hypothetical protein
VQLSTGCLQIAPRIYHAVPGPTPNNRRNNALVYNKMSFFCKKEEQGRTLLYIFSCAGQVILFYLFNRINTAQYFNSLHLVFLKGLCHKMNIIF